jgi:hypothetical protein
LDQYLVTSEQRIHLGYIDRGFPLIYSAEVWAERYNRLLTMSYMVRMFPFMIPVVFASMVDIGAIVLPLVVLSPFYLYFSYDTYRSYRVVMRGEAPPGVYALGVELPMAPYYSKRYFLAWPDIEGIQVHRPGFLMRRVVNLRLYGSNLPWTFPLSFLGESELVTLKALVDEMRMSDPSAFRERIPELVLYGTQGREHMRNS